MITPRLRASETYGNAWPSILGDSWESAEVKPGGTNFTAENHNFGL